MPNTFENNHQHSEQFLRAKGRMRVSALFHVGLVNEKPRASAIARKSFQAIAPLSLHAFFQPLRFSTTAHPEKMCLAILSGTRDTSILTSSIEWALLP